MTLVLITPASSFAVTVAEVKADQRVEHTVDDTMIGHLIAAAFAYAERRTGVAFSASTWEYRERAFPDAELLLPLTPVVSVTSVKYDDADGVEQTFTDFTLDGDWIVPTGAWPTPRDARSSVRVRFVTGGTPLVDVCRAVRLIAGHWYLNRAAADEAKRYEIPIGAHALLDLHRQMFV